MKAFGWWALVAASFSATKFVIISKRKAGEIQVTKFDKICTSIYTLITVSVFSLFVVVFFGLNNYLAVFIVMAVPSLFGVQWAFSATPEEVAALPDPSGANDISSDHYVD